MPRASYVNGRYVPHLQAMVHIEDRGYQFADGVYEVIGVFGGCLIDVEEHLDRLERSLSELRMVPPLGRTTHSCQQAQSDEHEQYGRQRGDGPTP